jgi:hypothetical protein
LAVKKYGAKPSEPTAAAELRKKLRLLSFWLLISTGFRKKDCTSKNR